MPFSFFGVGRKSCIPTTTISFIWWFQLMSSIFLFSTCLSYYLDDNTIDGAVDGSSLGLNEYDGFDTIGDYYVQPTEFRDWKRESLSAHSKHYEMENEHHHYHDRHDESDRLNVPHPIRLHNWGSRSFPHSQISGISMDPINRPVIIDRSDRIWSTSSTENGLKKSSERHDAIETNVISVIDPETGEIVEQWGANFFHIPHGLHIDGDGNVYVTDVGTHQVFKFNSNSTVKPEFVLGEKFVSGSDGSHFCQPTDVAVDDQSGTIFVADGYCNSRVVKFNKNGRYIGSIDSAASGSVDERGRWEVVHSIALFPNDNILCISDREGHKIDCVTAGLETLSDIRSDGDVVATDGYVELPDVIATIETLFPIYGITAIGETLLAVGLNSGVTFQGDWLHHSLKQIDSWGDQNAMNWAHDITVSKTGDSVYVVQVPPNPETNLGKLNSPKDLVMRFEVIKPDHSNDYIET